MHLSEIFSFSERRILDDSAPAVRIGQASVPDGVENIIPRIDGCNRAVECLISYFTGTQKSWDNDQKRYRISSNGKDNLPDSTIFLLLLFLFLCWDTRMRTSFPRSPAK